MVMSESKTVGEVILNWFLDSRISAHVDGSLDRSILTLC